jgi:anti-anti-sigma factor
VVPPSFPIGSPPVASLAVSVDLPRARVSVSGELDRESAHHLLDALTMLTTRSSRRWRLDAGGVTFCDAGGVRALSGAHALATEHGRSLDVERTSRSVDRVVDLLGRDRVFPAAPSSADGGRVSAEGQSGGAGSAAPARRAGATPAWKRRIRCCTTGTA